MTIGQLRVALWPTRPDVDLGTSVVEREGAMSFSQPSAEPVVTSPGRKAPPPEQPPAPGGRPFLDLIAEAYHSEGRTVPDRVLAFRQDERTAPGRRFDETDEPLDEEKTTEDRPSHRQKTQSAHPLRGFVADPLTSLATDTSLSPNALQLGDGRTPVPLSRVQLRREYRSLPVVLGKAVVRAGRGDATKGHTADPILEATEPELESESGPKALPIRILPPIEGKLVEVEPVPYLEHPDEDTLAIAIDIDIDIDMESMSGGAPLSPMVVELSADDIVMQRPQRRPPPVPEPTEIKRVMPPPLPDFAIPPRPIAASGEEGVLTDPHGRVFTADDFVLSDKSGGAGARPSGDVFVERPDDTDPFAKVIAAEAANAERHVEAAEQTIELSLGLLEELMLLEDQDLSLTGQRTLPDLRLQDLQRLSTAHGLSFVGAVEDEDDASQTAPTFAVHDLFSHSEPSTGTGPVAHLPVIVRQDPPVPQRTFGQDILSPQAHHGRDKIAREIEVPDAPDLDTGPARNFTLTGLVLARPTEDGEQGAKRRKGHSIFAAAMKDYVEGRTKAANTNAMLALAYDPANKVYRAAIERWGREAKCSKGRKGSASKGGSSSR